MQKHNYDAEKIESYWQKQWSKQGIFKTNLSKVDQKSEYVLVEWPYPSGNLHIGHWYAFAVPDIYVRYRRMTGVNVLHPMGFDAFGLPAENAAIKHKVNPRNWTEQNIKTMRTQLDSMGNAFSWEQTCSSIDPEYYKWTQWMFTKFFETGLAYKGSAVVNWDPIDNTVIANEQVLPDGTSERSGAVVERKEMPQWMIRITNYADRLIDDLDNLDWPEHIKEAQRQWIGRSKGVEIDFTLSTDDTVTCFTTRPDTLYGATYLVLAPEHSLVQKLQSQIVNCAAVVDYVKATRQKKEQDRLDDTKEKTGVRLEGITATNPASGEEIPVFIADYVLAHYGTGAIMAVPAHDERDYAFAKKYNLEIRQVIAPIFYGEGDDAPREDVVTNHGRACVDIIIEHPTDGTFLLQREKDGGRDLVHFVGGGTDGEDDLTAVARELREETGFTEFELVSEKPIFVTQSIGFRHNKGVNQEGVAGFYHVKLKSLKQVTSEVDQGKHTTEWVPKDKIGEMITWAWRARAWQAFLNEQVHVGGGVLIYSGEFDGLDNEAAKEAIVAKVGGRWRNTYRLRDWSIGRQRYWGTPIPIVYDPEGNAHPVPEEHLPWLLPDDVDFTPTGEAPLAKSAELKARTEKIFGPGWTPEVETMDTFVDSSWYYLRYLDPSNTESLASLKLQQDWLPIDIYFGGAEHTTMHLLYSRFWQKALYDLKLTPYIEPYKKRINRGLILGPDGNKMSKSKGNVVDPDEQVRLVGADTVKMYLAFMGPYEGSNYPWDPGGVAGIRRFLDRVHALPACVSEVAAPDEEVLKILHKTAKKIHTDIPHYKFNTAISALMICLNVLEQGVYTKTDLMFFLRLLAPFAPHLTEELWYQLGNETSIHVHAIPEPDPALLIDREVIIGVQINGKLRGKVAVAPDAIESSVLEVVFADPVLSKRVTRESVSKVIYRSGKILNLLTTNLVK